MAKKLTRKRLIAGAAPLLAAGPLARLALADNGNEQHGGAEHQEHASHAGHEQATGHQQAAPGHGAMIGDYAPAVGGPRDLDALLYPPEALPYEPGRRREYTLTAVDREIEVAPGVFYAAWTYNGTVPGPVIRATEGDRLSVRFVNGGSHPHTIHFHGIHPANMDGVFEVVQPGGEITYEFEARPAGFHLYHCHVMPLKKHIHKGLYGAFVIDPRQPRPPAQELVMVMNGYDTDGDGGNNFYTVNGRSFYYAKYPLSLIHI